jgi:serine/threonine-protein kinase
MGTPLYMSPEQVEGKDVDPRSYLYSLGVTSYHMLAGRPPFDGETALAVAVQHLKTEPPRLELERPDLPEGLCRIVHKLLAKLPRDRYQKAVDLLKDLRTIQVPGLEVDWPADLPAWGGDAATTPDGRLAVTQQLSRIMHVDAGVSQGTRTAGHYALVLTALTLLGVGAGSAAAWLARPKPLLEASATSSKIPRMNSAEEQFFFAKMATRDHEEAWLAVATYFPPDESPLNKRYARLATKGLANFYLSNNRLLEARKGYEELAGIDLKSEPNEKPLHVAGLAGCTIVAYRQIDANRQETALPLQVCLAKLYTFSDDDLADIGPQLTEALTEVLEAFPRPVAE